MTTAQRRRNKAIGRILADNHRQGKGIAERAAERIGNMTPDQKRAELDRLIKEIWG